MSLLRQWRYLLLTLLAVVALAAVAACGDDDDDDDDTSATATEAPSGDETDAPSDGDRIQGGDMVVQSNEPDSLDPHFSSFAQDISLHRMLWRGLYWLDADYNVTPGMAAALPEISDDGKTFTITVRDGLTWSDGDDLTSEDFVLGLTRTCNPDNAGQYQYVLGTIVGCQDYYDAYLGPDGEADTDDDLPAGSDLSSFVDALGVKVIDATTLEITLTDAQPTFPIILSLWMTFPAPVHLFPDPGEEWPAGPSAPAALAYNGPYIMTEYTPQDHATLAPNPNWAAPNDVSPTLDTLTLRFIDDTAVANNAYRNDELSFSRADTTVLPAVVQEFGENEEYFKSLQPSTRGLQMNLDRPPLDNELVRLAFSQAIDRTAMVEVVTNGANDATTSWLPAVVPGGDEPDAFQDCCGFDAAKAAATLEEAGYPGGEGFPDNLNILVGDSPAARATAEFLQEQLSVNLGITVGIEVVDAATRSDRFRSEDFDLFPGGWIQDYPDPENWIVGLFDTPGPLNHYNCSNAEIDQLIADNLYNPDNDARVDAYHQINAIISETACGIAPYWHENNHYLIKPNVVGMEENIGGQDAFQAGDWIAEAWGFSE